MLKRITVTRHETVESWNSWIVAVPDNMDDERIEELMRECWDKGDLGLDEEEPSVDIADAPPIATPDLTLTENDLVDTAAEDNQCPRFLVELEIDETQLRNSVSADDDDHENISSLVECEMGWLEESGIYAVKVKCLSRHSQSA
jgi:hypothetical protein